MRINNKTKRYNNNREPTLNGQLVFGRQLHFEII